MYNTLIPYEHLEQYQEFLYIQYIDEKLNEAEALENDPANRLNIDKFMDNVKNWKQKNDI